MLVVRTARLGDLDPLFDLIGQSELGLTTLKISKEKLSRRIQDSIQAFARDDVKPAGQPYVFVMEDLANGQIVGTSAIYSKVGGFQPFYSYEIRPQRFESAQLDVCKEIPTLHLLEAHDGPTEIGSLFLHPDYWGNGHGRLLSLSRFLFMAEFASRFEREVIAELRGVVEKSGKSPLWAALGSHFFQIEFPRAETLTSENKKFIADLMPRHPIYIPLLPQEAQNVLGQVHANTRPARAMLEQEGFEYRGIVDIFDGGPTVHAGISDIRVVRENVSGEVQSITANVDGGRKMLVANTRLDFKCCLGMVACENNLATIDEVTALRLDLKQGDRLRFVDIKPAQPLSQEKTK